MSAKFEKHIRVYQDRSEFWVSEQNIKVFKEGVVSSKAKQRTRLIRQAFENGFLEKIATDVKSGMLRPDMSMVSTASQRNLRELVDSVTSEVGRALIGLAVMQLSIKALAPDQSIRLHKASANSTSFSWVEGVSMRTLDKAYVTPALRRFGLVRLNADGFMMTRSLAENYPYSDLYKASLRGARQQWLDIVEDLEADKTDAMQSLIYLISLLQNSADDFVASSNLLLERLEEQQPLLESKSAVCRLLIQHIDGSDYAARLLEVAMHSLMQAAIEIGCLEQYSLKPLSQMRSANKKHGNIADIELLEGRDIIEAWDAKYGKTYLREELEEISEKLELHENVQVVGFVTTGEPQRTAELTKRIADIEELHSVRVTLFDFNSWVEMIFQRCCGNDGGSPEELAFKWIRCYAETLCQRRRAMAPIDEPCQVWVSGLKQLLDY